MSDTLETKYYRTPEGTRYRVRIVADPDASSPRDADNPTIMHTFDGGYISPDGAVGADVHELFPSDYDVCSNRSAGNASFDLRRAKKYAALDPNILAVRGLDRDYDGTLRLSDDDETAGYIAITRESWEKCMGDSPLEGRPWLLTKDGRPDPENLEGNRTPSADEVIQQDLDAYNRWASGEYVGVVVEMPLVYALDQSQGPWDGHAVQPPDSITKWVQVESCWGYDDQDYALKEAVSTLPEGVEEE